MQLVLETGYAKPLHTLQLDDRTDIVNILKVRPHLQPNPDLIYMNSVCTKVLTYKSRSIVDH